MPDQKDTNEGLCLLSVDDEPKVPFSMRIRKPLKDKLDKLNKTDKIKLNEKIEEVIAREIYISEFDLEKFLDEKKDENQK